MKRGETRPELSRVLAIEETEEAHDAIVRSFWTRARAKTLSTCQVGAPLAAGLSGAAGGARVIDLLAWTGALRRTPR